MNPTRLRELAHLLSSEAGTMGKAFAWEGGVPGESPVSLEQRRAAWELYCRASAVAAELEIIADGPTGDFVDSLPEEAPG